VRVGDHTCAVKETDELIARREYHLLRDLRKMGLPTVVPQAVVTGRKDRRGDWLPSALVTRQLRFSLPYRSLFSRGMRADSLPALVDALVVLLVRLHLSGFFWGDVSLSNVLFRRSAGEFAAYLVDAETGELKPALSDQQRDYDLTVARENLYGELLDLQAGDLLERRIDPSDVVDLLAERYEALWNELTGPAEFGADEMWRIEKRISRLNDLGFDVDELDIVTDWDGSTVRIQPKVVDPGHHERRLQGLTGLDVEENQARRLLNDLDAFAAANDLQGEDPAMVAHRWLTEIFLPIVESVPPERRAELDPAELFHEILEHRWYLSERAGHEIGIFPTAEDYVRQAVRGVVDASTSTDISGEVLAEGPVR
ncbi:MAG: hypothetical protein QOI51_583, partial [Nocardioidaceae bacterium]|nr:hypothetical protein [Nocardioidaceae bacterium]